jgi:uncharacterized Tic20 family protein
MTTRICLACKEDVKGFVYCPKCGGQTEIIESLDVNPNSMTFDVDNPAKSSQLAMWCHLAPLLIGIISFFLAFVAIGFVLILFAWVPPLLIKNSNQSDVNVQKHANEALNFQFFWLITSTVIVIAYFIIGIFTLGIGLVVGGIVGFLLIFPLMLFLLISQIRATSAAAAGKEFVYPLVLFRVIKN